MPDRHDSVVDYVRQRIPQQAQRQDSLLDQLKDLHAVAARLGMYDAADTLWKVLVDPEVHA